MQIRLRIPLQKCETILTLPGAESGRGFVAPIWRGFRWIWVLTRGTPVLLTREPGTHPDTLGSALRLSRSLLTGRGAVNS